MREYPLQNEILDMSVMQFARNLQQLLLNGRFKRSGRKYHDVRGHIIIIIIVSRPTKFWFLGTNFNP